MSEDDRELLAPPLAAPLAPGDRLDRYELLCPVASGGMASVWVARLQGKHGFEKLVAIKTILPQFAGDVRFRDMFLDEARILSRIQHVNVAQVLDMGEEHGLLYLVMEFVDGDPFSKLLKVVRTKGLPVPAGVLLRVCADTCAGLHAAHELRDPTTRAPAGVVHRDVSPQNILVTREGAAKLIDFGIVKATGRIAPQTQAGGVKGKILYMAPEQGAARDVDRRADVWAMGAILYSAYAQRTPYEADTEIDTLQALARGNDPPPLDDSVPAPIREVVARATAYAVEARYASALEMGRALEDAMAKMGAVTSQTDVAAFIEQHLSDRADARRRTLDLALRAAAQRAERGHLAKGPASGAADNIADRVLHRGLDSSLPPPSPEPAFGGTLLFGLPPAPRVPAEALAQVTEQSAPPVPEVPDLVLKPAPPKRKPPPPPMPALEDDDDVGPVRAPPPMIASAAGSILGPDVLGPKPPPPVGGRPPPPPPDAEPHSQEFMDPSRIAATRQLAQSGTTDPRTARTSPAPPPPNANDVVASAQAIPQGRPLRAIVADVGAAVRAEREARDVAQRRTRIVAVGGALFLVVVVGLIVAALAPGYAQRALVAAAGQQGLTLTIERTTVGLSSVHAYGLTLASTDLRGATLTAAEATIELHILDPEAIVVQDPSLSIDGATDETAAAIERVRARVSAASPSTKRLTLQNGKIAWTGPLGPGSRVDVEGLGLELARADGARTLGEEAHLTAPNVRIATARGTLGPWRIDGERTVKTGRLRVGFDPVLADGPSAILVRSENGTTATLKISRQPLARIGIPYAFLGLAADGETQIEATAQLTRPLPTRVVGEAAVTIFDARIHPDGQRLDVVLRGQFAGAPGQPLDVARAQLSFGPLTALVSGAVTLFDESFRVDLKWSVPPLPCGVLLKKQSPLQASAAGLASFDSRRPDQATFTLTDVKTCGLPIFP